ncbi:MAG: PTS sugar transporter subunit IIA [Spirochaetales bacterium]|jgi:mannitol/fructose-specific phosphotransferase system IIA component (Ntr-type)|nr:PTS sugar transporter subunit IIA [Spirochaetales bacterium]
MGGICKRMLPECVVLNPPGQDKESIIRELVGLLTKAYEITDSEQLVSDILEREELTSTCLGFGCAVPHAHSVALNTTIIAAARLDPPRDFDTPDGEPVSLVFLLAGPEHSAGLHIRLLSKLARLLHDPAFREKLRSAEHAEEFHRLICQKDE